MITRAFHQGLLLLSCGQSTVRFMPPLMVSVAQVDEAITLLEAALDRSDWLDNGNDHASAQDPAGWPVVLCVPCRCWLSASPWLAQIQLPHNYYYREMYLPQLTSGPSALTFSPDGKELVYSMGGSLWRQTIGSDEARELTHAARLRLPAGLVA